MRVEDSAFETEIVDALSHLQAAADRLDTLGVESTSRQALGSAAFQLHQLIGAGEASWHTGKALSLGAHSE